MREIIVTGDMIDPRGYVNLSGVDLPAGELFQLTAYGPGYGPNEEYWKWIPDWAMFLARKVCAERKFHYMLERAKIYKSEEWKNSAFRMGRQTGKSLMVAGLMEDVEDCLRADAASKSVIQTVVYKCYPCGFLWTMSHMEYEFIRRWANHVIHDLGGSDLQQSSSAVLSTKHLGVRDTDHPTHTRSELRKERAKRRFETKNQGWRAGQGRIRGRNGY